MTALADHPDVVVDARDVAWRDGKPVRIRINGDWLKVTTTARPYRYRSRSHGDLGWDRGVHCFKDPTRRDDFMRSDIAWGTVVQPYEMTDDGPVYGLVLKSRHAILHRAAARRYETKKHAAHQLVTPEFGKTWCIEHHRHGCGPDAVAEYEEHGEWDYILDPVRLGWCPYSLLSDKPDPPYKVGSVTVYGSFRKPRYAKFHPPA